MIVVCQYAGLFHIFVVLLSMESLAVRVDIFFVQNNMAICFNKGTCQYYGLQISHKHMLSLLFFIYNKYKYFFYFNVVTCKKMQLNTQVRVFNMIFQLNVDVYYPSPVQCMEKTFQSRRIWPRHTTLTRESAIFRKNVLLILYSLQIHTSAYRTDKTMLIKGYIYSSVGMV